MKNIILIITSCFLISCEFHKEPEVILNYELTVGEWNLDSIPNQRPNNESLLILENYEVYKYSRFNGGELRNMGKLDVNDSIYTEYGASLKAELIKINTIRLHGGGWYKINEFYDREESKDLNLNFENYKGKDSLRSQILGWWKTVGTYRPIRLSNHSARPTKFVLNFKHNGEANIYLNNKLDSVANYSYRTNLDGIDLNRGDVVGWNSKISFDKKGNMKLVLGRRNLDTINLIRLKEIE